MIDFDRFEAVTFDCYGTLVDWESGITKAIQALFDPTASSASPEALLEAFGRFESEAEKGAFKKYRSVLKEVAMRIGHEFGVEVTTAGAVAFAESVGDWPPFPDTVEALGRLERRYRLCVVSNVDDDLFARTAARLGTSFSEVVTAEQVGSYKPRTEHFHEVLRRLDLPTERVLHVAQSLYHDIAPARGLGFACVWVNRRAGRAGPGATPPADGRPDLEVPDLASLVRVMGL